MRCVNKWRHISFLGINLKVQVKVSAFAWIQVSLLFVTENPRFKFKIWATCDGRDDSVVSSTLSEIVKSFDLLSPSIVNLCTVWKSQQLVQTQRESRWGNHSERCLLCSSWQHCHGPIPSGPRGLRQSLLPVCPNSQVIIQTYSVRVTPVTLTPCWQWLFW